MAQCCVFMEPAASATDYNDTLVLYDVVDVRAARGCREGRELDWCACRCQDGTGHDGAYVRKRGLGGFSPFPARCGEATSTTRLSAGLLPSRALQ